MKMEKYALLDTDFISKTHFMRNVITSTTMLYYGQLFVKI